MPWLDMAETLPCWDRLTDEERAACTGDLREAQCCSRYTWHALGELQSAWNDQIHPLLGSLISQNFKQVYGKQCVQSTLLFHFWLASTTKDPLTVRPTIFVLSTDKKIASRAKKLICKHDVFKDLHIGFDVVTERRLGIFFPSGSLGDMNESLRSISRNPIAGDRDAKASHPDVFEDNQPTSGPKIIGVLEKSRLQLNRPHEPQVLAGSSVLVVSSENGKRQRATVFCVVKIGGERFAVLPAHACYPEFNSSVPNQDNLNQDNSSGSESGTSNSSTEHNSEDSGYFDHSPSHYEGSTSSVTIIPPDTLSSCQVYLGERPVHESGSYSYTTFIGEFEPFLNVLSGQILSSYNRELDWVLVRLSFPEAVHSREQGESIITDAGRGESQYILDSPAGTVSLLSSSGIQKVKISGTAVTAFFPWCSDPCKVWEAEYALQPGDSGSPVIDDEGRFVGMALATIPDLRITYISPAALIIESICSVSVDPTLVEIEGVDLQEFAEVQGIVRKVSQLALHSGDYESLEHHQHDIEMSAGACESEIVRTQDDASAYDDLMTSGSIAWEHPTAEPRRSELAKAPSEDLYTSEDQSSLDAHYVCFAITRQAAGWDRTPSVTRILASQLPTEAFADVREGKAAALNQMQRMGPARHSQIDRLKDALDARENDGSIWEPIWIRNTETEETDVICFEVVFAKVRPSTTQSRPYQSSSEIYSHLLDKEAFIPTAMSQDGYSERSVSPYTSTIGDDSSQTSYSSSMISSLYREFGSQVDLTGTSRASLSLDYRVQRYPRGFFTTGRVFKVLWAMPVGVNLYGSHNASARSPGLLGEPIRSVVKWMMVVNAQAGHCICCPILGYAQSGRAGSEPGLQVAIHASDKSPSYMPDNDRTSIAIDLHHPDMISTSIKSSSYVDFSKFHTVEYNVRVLSVGHVHVDHIHLVSKYAKEGFG